jgi:hypothetical protein
MRLKVFGGNAKPLDRKESGRKASSTDDSRWESRNRRELRDDQLELDA